MSAYTIYRSSKGGQDVPVGEVDAFSAVTALEQWATEVGVGDYSIDQAGDRRYLCPAHSVLFFYTYVDDPAETTLYWMQRATMYPGWSVEQVREHETARVQVVTREAVEARMWDSERRSSPYSTVSDPDDETCEVCESPVDYSDGSKHGRCRCDDHQDGAS